MRKVAFGLALIAAIGAAVVCGAAGTADPPWQKLDEADGISVYGREISGVSLLAMRGDGVVNAPLLRVASVLVDTTRSHEWVDSVAETRTLRKISDLEYVQWNHVKTPWIVKDRDFVFTTKLSFAPATKQLSLDYHSVNDAAAPKTSYIRGQFTYGKFLLTSIDGGKRTRVQAELLCDPKGSLAKWMVNMVQKDWPQATLRGLRRQVAKVDIVDNPKLAQALVQAGY